MTRTVGAAIGEHRNSKTFRCPRRDELTPPRCPNRVVSAAIASQSNSAETVMPSRSAASSAGRGDLGEDGRIVLVTPPVVLGVSKPGLGRAGEP